MKVRQSASLFAGVCTVCVAASTSVAPVTSAAVTAPDAKSPVVRPFELTAASDVLVDGANVASLPLQNVVTLLDALAGAAGGGNGVGGGGATSLQALPNVLYAQLVAGTLTEASATAAINAALATEQTALTNLAVTPGKIIATDLATLGALFGGSTTSLRAAESSSATPELTPEAATQADTGSLVDAINVASLPLQNGITALNALAGAAGGGNGLGGAGATSFQALPNVLYSQLVAGTLTEASATKAINAAVATEQTALTNLAATPGKIIATDTAAVQKLVGNFGASTTTAAAPATITPTLKTSHLVTNDAVDQKDVKNVTAGPTTSGRHAARAKDHDSVSNAIKAIKDAPKGSYVGKHRAGAAGAKTSEAKGDGSTAG